MSEGRYIVGLDLGTTNSALAYVDASPDGGAGPVELFDVPQLVAPASVLDRKSLPSFLYLAQSGELPERSMDLPWAEGRMHMVGEAARNRGAEVPLRLVSSAKSWLGHTAVDRRASILPWGAPEGVEKVSPVDAMSRYLDHLRAAWNQAHPEDALEDQDLYLTVPASFDAAARELTLEAATRAGLSRVTLLEEPQAAFYAWLERIGDGWRDLLSPGDRVLVSDVGGGTTDFSLIEVRDKDGELELERVAVGDHILLGGDNMDLALAHQLSEQFREAGKKLDAGQQRQLISAAREAKEKLLNDAALDTVPITILGRGSKLIGGKLKTELTREALTRILIDGFFPKCSRTDTPAAQKRTGFMELGLPFAADAGITRHLAAFVARDDADKLPTHLLFNGGVFNSPVLRDRLIEVIGAWDERAPTVLEEADHDLAVARGAAYFGAARAGRGIRIRSKTARAYYIGVETAAPSVPGVRPPIRAMCVVPMGIEEGTQAEVPGAQLGLVVGEPVEFRFLTSSTRKQDQIGTVLDEYEWPDHLEETSSLDIALPAEGMSPGAVVPVKLEIKVTEIGTVEVWCARTDGDGRWRLELSMREQESAG